MPLSHCALSALSLHFLSHRSPISRYRRFLLSNKQKLLCCVNPEFRGIPTPSPPPVDKQIKGDHPLKQQPKNSNKHTGKQAQGRVKESRSWGMASKKRKTRRKRGERREWKLAKWNRKLKLRCCCAAGVAASSLCSFRIWFWFHSWNVRCAVMTLTVSVCCSLSSPHTPRLTLLGNK